MLDEPSEAQPTWSGFGTSLVVAQTVCGVADGLALMFQEGEQALAFVLDQRCVQRHSSSIAAKEDRTCPVFTLVILIPRPSPLAFVAGAPEDHLRSAQVN